MTVPDLPTATLERFRRLFAAYPELNKGYPVWFSRHREGYAALGY